MARTIQESVWTQGLRLNDTNLRIRFRRLDQLLNPSFSYPSIRIQENDVVASSFAYEEVVRPCKAQVGIGRTVVVNQNLIIARMFANTLQAFFQKVRDLVIDNYDARLQTESSGHTIALILEF